MSEQVSIEADRLSRAMKDGVEAAQAASRNYGDLFMDTYLRVTQASMRNGLEMGGHMLALMQAKTVADAFKMNVDFMQRQMSTLPERFFEVMDVKTAATDRKGRTDSRASLAQPKIVLDRSGQQGHSATPTDGRDGGMIQA